MKALWHSMSCVCQDCLDVDAYYIRFNIPVLSGRPLFETEEAA